MALSSRRSKSRRRFAALSFLNNITLNGSHVDTNLSMFLNLDDIKFTRIENLTCPKTSAFESSCHQEFADFKAGINQTGVKLCDNDCSIESEIQLNQTGIHKLPEADFNRISNILTPFRER